jgi:hypothetical protein
MSRNRNRGGDGHDSSSSNQRPTTPDNDRTPNQRPSTNDDSNSNRNRSGNDDGTSNNPRDTSDESGSNRDRNGNDDSNSNRDRDGNDDSNSNRDRNGNDDNNNDGGAEDAGGGMLQDLGQEFVGGVADGLVQSFTGEEGEGAGGVAGLGEFVGKGLGEGGKALADGLTGGLISKAEEAEKQAKKVEDGKKALEDSGPAKTSDELLDAGKVGLEFFEKFLPLLKEWAGQAPDFKGEICRQYDDLREIDFGAFREDAGRLEEVHKALLEQNDSMNRAFQDAKSTWKGSAADAAGSKVGAYTGGGTTVINEIEKLGGAITPAMDGIEQSVRQYAEFVLGFGASIECAGKSPEETKDEIRKAKGDIQPQDLGDVGLDDVFSGALSAMVGTAKAYICSLGALGPLAGIFGAKDACDKIKQGLIDDAKKWLDGSFKPEIQAKVNEFKQQSTTAANQIQKAYDQLLQAGKVSDDPFKAMGEGKGEGKKGGGSGSGENSGGGGGGTGGGGGGTGGGGTGGGGPGGGPGGGASVPPPPPMTPTPQPGEGGGHGGPLGPGAPPGPGQGQPETVTVGQGKDGVTVQEPDPKGGVKVTVMGEDGQPKVYDVALGGQGGPAPGQPGQIPGQPGQIPGQAPGMPGQAAGLPGVGGQPGAGMPGGDHGQPIQPGPDGKAVIHEGDRTVTLERTPEGEVKVSVDNANGQPPTDQTLSFDKATGEDPSAPGRNPMGEAGPGVGPAPGDRTSVPPQPGVGGPGESMPQAPPAQEPMAASAGASASAGFGGAEASAPAGVGADTGSPAAAVAGGPAQTTSQSAGFTSLGGDGMQNSFASAAGQLFGGHEGAPGQPPPPGGQPGQPAGAVGLASMNPPGPPGGPQGATGLPSMGDPAGGQGPGGGQAGAQGAGGGMMGMGAMGGAAQQGGGDQERTNSSPWRTQGQLFDDGVDSSSVRYRSVLGEDKER